MILSWNKNTNEGKEFRFKRWFLVSFILSINSCNNVTWCNWILTRIRLLNHNILTWESDPWPFHCIPDYKKLISKHLYIRMVFGNDSNSIIINDKTMNTVIPLYFSDKNENTWKTFCFVAATHSLSFSLCPILLISSSLNNACWFLCRNKVKITKKRFIAIYFS